MTKLTLSQLKRIIINEIKRLQEAPIANLSHKWDEESEMDMDAPWRQADEEDEFEDFDEREDVHPNAPRDFIDYDMPLSRYRKMR